MSRHKPLSVPWIIAIVLAVMICGYFGTYYVVVKPLDLGPAFGIVADYVAPFDGSKWKKFFQIANELDRHTRPDVWAP